MQDAPKGRGCSLPRVRCQPGRVGQVDDQAAGDGRGVAEQGCEGERHQENHPHRVRVPGTQAERGGSKVKLVSMNFQGDLNVILTN